MKIYIAEDEPLAAAKLKLFIEKLESNVEISTFDNGISALAAIDREKPDLLFLDIQMPGLTGMQVLEKGVNVPVIITSAYDQYAIDSFSFNVTDYLLKPYTLERLKMALDKAHKAIRLQALDQESAPKQISIRVDGANEIIQIDNIRYLESDKDYVRFVTTDSKRRLLTKASMNSFEEQLPKDKFSRVHRSYIVNNAHVESWALQSLTMNDGTEIPIGKTYRKLINK